MSVARDTFIGVSKYRRAPRRAASRASIRVGGTSRPFYLQRTGVERENSRRINGYSRFYLLARADIDIPPFVDTTVKTPYVPFTLHTSFPWCALDLLNYQHTELEHSGATL